MHFADYALHDLNGTWRAGHDACAQASQIKTCELRMLEFGDKHCGHAMQRRAALFRRGTQCLQRIEERRGNDHRRARHHAHHVGQHHAKTVVERDRYAQAIVRRKLHGRGSEAGIVHNVMVRECRALRHARCARRVLEIDGVVELERALALAKVLFWCFLREAQEFTPGKDPIRRFARSKENYVPEIGNLVRTEIVTRALRQFRRDGAQSLDIVAVAKAFA